MARPEKNIDPLELQRIMVFYPSLEEVSSWFNCSCDTIERRVRDLFGCDFKTFRESYAGKTRLLLKRKAISKALEEDNEKMLLYCLRTMTELDDRRVFAKKENEQNSLALNYSLDFISDEEKNL